MGELLADTIQPNAPKGVGSIRAPSESHWVTGAYFWARYRFMRSNAAALPGMTFVASAIISASKYTLSFTDARSHRLLTRLLLGSEAIVAAFNDA